MEQANGNHLGLVHSRHHRRCRTNSRGRSGAGWFLLSSLLLSPLLGLILVLCLTNLRKQTLEKPRHDELLRALGASPIPLPPPLPTQDEQEIERRVAEIKRELAVYQSSRA
jgi:hypothetical protein